MSTSRAVRDAANPTMTLHDCPLNARVVVDGIDLDDRHRFRLCEIGLAPGTGLRVVQRSAFGGRVIAFGNERVAVDGGTARAVRVRFAQDWAVQDSAAQDKTARHEENGNTHEC